MGIQGYCTTELVFPAHFLKIVAEMNTSGPPHVLKLLLGVGNKIGGKAKVSLVGGRQGHTPCEILSLQQSLFLCHSNFMEVIRLSQRLGHLQC